MKKFEELKKTELDFILSILDAYVFADPSMSVEAILTPDVERAIQENMDILKYYCEHDEEPGPAEVEAVDEACRHLFRLCGPQVIGSIVYNRKFVIATIKANKAIADYPELAVVYQRKPDLQKLREVWQPNYRDLKVIWQPERNILAAWMELAGVQREG